MNLSFFSDDTTPINHASDSIDTIWSNIVKDRHEVSHYNKCKRHFNEILNQKDWKKRKDVYYYFINYEYIQKLYPFFSNECEEYCEYIEKKSYSYDISDNVCTKEESNCSHFYNKYKKYNPNTVFKTLKCPEN
ncbi:Plasmodium vivax Vir protein, putative, partial [Plasmodium ovale]